MSFRDYADSRKEDYKNADIKTENNIKEVEEGKYQAEIYNSYIGKAQSTGDYYVKWDMSILGPKNEGSKISKFYSLSKPKEGKIDRIIFLKKDLFTVGVEMTELTDLEDALPVLVGRKVEIEVYVNKRGYTEISIKNLILDEVEEKSESDELKETAF